MSSTLAAAVLDLGLEMCFYLKRNCLFKFEFSIWSGSVMVIFPFYPAPNPIMAKFFSNSHPIAPDPIINEVEFLINSSSYLPTTISKPLYR